MNREREDGIVFCENGGSAVTVMNVSIDDHGLADGAIGLQPANGYGNVMNGAKAFAMVGVGVMETPTDVAAKPVLQRRLGGQNRASGSKPEGADKFRRVRNFELHDITECESAGLQFADPVRGVYAQQIGIAGGFGPQKISAIGNFVGEELFFNQTVFLRGKTCAPRFRS